MTKAVRPMMGVASTRYECMTCGALYASDEEALRCEGLHAVDRMEACEDSLDISDHAGACVALLRKYLHRLEQGVSPEDIGPDITLLGRMMARRT